MWLETHAGAYSRCWLGASPAGWLPLTARGSEVGAVRLVQSPRAPGVQRPHGGVGRVNVSRAGPSVRGSSPTEVAPERGSSFLTSPGTPWKGSAEQSGPSPHRPAQVLPPPAWVLGICSSVLRSLCARPRVAGTWGRHFRACLLCYASPPGRFSNSEHFSEAREEVGLEDCAETHL